LHRRLRRNGCGHRRNKVEELTTIFNREVVDDPMNGGRPTLRDLVRRLFDLAATKRRPSALDGLLRSLLREG
jgi:hypothetical protein